jgi:endonuclease/exonuclease/phosphatase family metal-dependent hydrolase
MGQSRGRVVHVLCSHPTPPAFDGPENRNKLRNHDEIRFWRDYLQPASEANSYIVDDAGVRGPLSGEASFVIVGDLNADAQKGRGSSIDDPIASMILASPRVLKYGAPAATKAVDDLLPTDTAAFTLRVDYVLPSSDFVVKASWIHRDGHEIVVDAKRRRLEAWPSDHFPVVVEVEIPAAGAARKAEK